jgi:hypothetical protein
MSRKYVQNIKRHEVWKTRDGTVKIVVVEVPFEKLSLKRIPFHRYIQFFQTIWEK